MNDLWTNRLSEYIDGELDTSERAELEQHLATCGHCYATLADLRDVVARAKTLADREPAQDLWAGIRSGIDRNREVQLTERLVRRRFSLTVGQLLAASIALVLLSGSGAWLALKPKPTTVTPAPTPTAARVPGTEIQVNWTSRTDQAVADLQDALVRNESQLDTATVRVVRQALATIDRAIADARLALDKDPGNTYLNHHLANTMRRKLELLRRVNSLVAES
jgi:anti-sigma factor RsiW